MTVGTADVARLVALAMIWGASFTFYRVLVPALGALPTAALRVLIAGLVLAAWLRVTGVDADVRRHWRAYLFVGVVNSAIPFALFGYAAHTLTAAVMSVLNASAPLFASLLAVRWLGERLDARKLTGIGLGIVGVAMVTGGGVVDGTAAAWWAVAACLAAALAYAISGIWLKRNGQGVSPYAMAGWSQLFAGFVLLPSMTIARPPGPITVVVVANALGLALLCSAVAYLLYYRLIRDLGPTRAMTVTFLIPVFGILWGALLLGEPVTLAVIGGTALVVAGTALVLRQAPARGAAGPKSRR